MCYILPFSKEWNERVGGYVIETEDGQMFMLQNGAAITVDGASDK